MSFVVGERHASNNVIEVGCTDWAEFRSRIITDLFEDGQFRKGKYLFRGQGSDSWKLSTTFDRWYGGSREKKNATADLLLEEFAAECALEEMPETLRKDKLAMLGLGQHHGLPTRLLDWTESPYVAAFFAFSGHVRAGLDPENYVAIWVMDSENGCWSEEHGCSIEDVPAIWNPRIKNQFGKFTHLRAPYDTLEEHVGNFGKGEVILTKYVVPTSEFRRAMAELDAMGLTHARIYPGLEGNARAAEVRVTLAEP